MDQEKDKAYKVGRSVIVDKTVKQFREIFNYVPVAVVARDIPIHWATLAKRRDDLGQMTLRDLNVLAKQLGMDPMTIIGMANAEYLPEFMQGAEKKVIPAKKKKRKK